MVQGLGVWPIAGPRQTGRWGQGRGSTVAPCFPTPRRARTTASGAASGRAEEGSQAWFCGVWHGVWAGFRIMSDNASLSDISTHDKRGGFRATQRDKAPRKIHHAPVIRADLDLLADRLPDTFRSAFLRRLGSARAHKATLSENPGTASLSAAGADPGLGAGAAEGQGRASRCLPPAPGSLCSTHFCAPIRPPPGRCAPAWRCRAPRPPPKSCASTPTKPRCATSASPSATRSGPRRTSCRSGAMAPAGRPASTQAGSSTRRRGSTWLWTRTASQRA